MVKWLLTLSFALISFHALADVNSDASSCLTGNSSNTTRPNCIQSTIANDQANLINNLIGTYANTVNTNIKIYGSNTSTSTPATVAPGTSSSGSGTSSGTGSQGSNVYFSSGVKSPPPTGSQGQIPNVNTPPPAGTPSKAPQNSSGIQYY